MKKILSLMLILALLIPNTSFLAKAEGEKVLLSHFFADGVEGFELPATNAEVKEDPLTGKKALHIVDDDNVKAFGFRSLSFDAVPGAEYTISTKYRCVSGSIKIYIWFMDTAGKVIYSKSYAVKGKGADVYTTSSVKHIAPEEAIKTKVIIQTVEGTLSEVWFESVSLVEKITKTYTLDIKKSKSNENKNFHRFAVDATEDFTVKAVDTKIETKENSVCATAAPGPVITYIPSEPIFIDNLNMKIRYKFKAVSDVKIDSFHITLYEKGSTSPIKLLTYSYPASNKWCEKEIEIVDFPSSGSPSGFSHGDYIEKIELKVINNYNQPTTAYFEYIEFVGGQEDIWGSPSGQEIIDEVVEKTSKAKPGDTIIIPNGTYTGVSFKLNGKGEEGKPITIKAETPGGVVIKGLSSMTVAGEFLTVDGLFFNGAWSANIIGITGAHCRLTNTAMVNCNSKDPSVRSQWITAGGQYARVDHCFFNHKSNHGVLFSISRKDKPNYASIDHNYFGHFEKSVVGNGAETIRTGSGAEAFTITSSVIENNFFEECNGETELISVKSSDTTMRNNTFLNSEGGICLRIGNDNVVDGNLFYNTVGVRGSGENHIIKNNYFFNASAYGISLDAGNEYNDAQYVQIKNAVVENNTLEDCKIPFFINNNAVANDSTAQYPRIYPPEGILKNNLVVSYNPDPAIKVLFEAPMMKYLNNHQVGGEKSDFEGFDYNEVSIRKSDAGLKYSDSTCGTSADFENKISLDPKEFLPEWIVRKIAANEEGFDAGRVEVFKSPEEISIIVDSKPLTSDVLPFETRGRVLVPMRAIFEALGASVSWDDATRSATAVSRNQKTTLKITENNNTAYINGSPVTLDVPATIKDGRFVVPVRFISESLGAKVSWNDLRKIVTVTPVYDFENMKKVDVTNIKWSDSNGKGKTGIQAVDGDPSTSWVASGKGVWMSGEFTEEANISVFKTYFRDQTSRTYNFEIFLSQDGVNYEKVFEGTTTNNDDGDIFPANKLTKAKHFKFVGQGGSNTDFILLHELEFYKE